MALPDSVLNVFRPRTSPPTASQVLRTILWPLAILFIIHRSYVLATNGYITDDYGPVYRAVSNFRRGLDIYNEHFDYVDPHYLYPPGGTLLMAPFGYLPVDASRYWFIFFNTVAMIIAAYLLIRLFKFTVTSVAFPALLAAMFCTEAVVNTLVFANINGIILLLEVLFFRWMLDGKVRPSVVGRRRDRVVAGGQTAVSAAALAAAAQPAMARTRHRDRGAAGVQPGGDAVGRRPDELLPQTLPYILRRHATTSTARSLGNGLYYGLPMWLIVLLRIIFALIGRRRVVAAVPLLPHPRPVVLVHAPPQACC